MKSSKPSEGSIVAGCRRGDMAAFRDLYTVYSKQLYRACCAMLGNEHDAQDVLQVVFTEAYRKFHRYDGTSKLSTWLYGILTRVVSNQRRSIRRRVRLAEVYGSEPDSANPTSGTMERRAAAKQTLAYLATALQEIPERKRLAFVLYYIQGMTLEEVAAITGISAQGAFGRVKSARAVLLERFWNDAENETEEVS
ncbi:MAG: sigma-70 family RNA polymerase sigma factor [Myxococcota bacterium]